jgi:ribonuclease HI
MAAPAARFAARPLALLAGEIADALDWPRSRPARLLAGERAARVARLALCVDEGALASLDASDDTCVLLATPPRGSDGRLGRRIYDPFAGTPGEPATWHRAERCVLDASLLLAGGRGGFDERLAQAAGAQPPHGHRTMPPLRSMQRDAAKLVGYVPVESLEAVRDAVFATGAGTIGDYDRCSWSTRGIGTFRGGADTDPTIGSPGSFERVEEERFEVIVASHLVERACRAYVAAHPYEEPAFDVQRLVVPAPVGFGRLGVLGAGGGAAAWSALGELDPELEAYGAVDRVPAGAPCALYTGPLRDVLDDVLAESDLALLVVGEASELELELLASREIAVLVADRARLVDAWVVEVAGALTRALTLPVAAEASLHFPEETHLPTDAADEQLATFAVAAPAAGTVAPDAATGTWRLHFDGGSRGNPGPAAYGWVLYGPDGEEVDSDGVTIGSATNNVAEWTGLLRGLEHAVARGIRNLSVRGDSELVVKQVTGVYRVKNAALKPLAEQVAAVLRSFDHVDVKHVYRDDNARADAVANEALDGLR